MHRQADELPAAGVVEELPGQRGQVGGGEAQLEAQAVAGADGALLADVGQRLRTSPAQQRVGGAEPARTSSCSGVSAPPLRPPDLRRRDLQVLETARQLLFVEGEAHLRARLAGRRPPDGNRIVSPVPDADVRISKSRYSGVILHLGSNGALPKNSTVDL
ncbi:MAG: hypothetical protein R2844_11995 [Caldilineales bacterium]